MSRSTRFIDACHRRPTDCTPIWLMRQAGRYQASYAALRRKHSFVQICRTPELAAQATVAAVDELGVDAGIIFSDILVAVEAMGAAVTYTEDGGPLLQAPVRDEAAVRALAVPDPLETVPFLLEAIRQARRALDGRVPLIGFAGAPLTLAAYLVEGGGSKSYPHLRELLFGRPGVAHELLDRLARTVAAQLKAQVEAGCQAVQLFDTWGGTLGREDYRTFGLPHIQRIMAELDGCGVPRILFCANTSSLLEVLAEGGAEVVGLDWRVDLRQARARLGPGVVVQGNLDPGCLFLPRSELDQRVRRVLEAAGKAPGYIFNLGHGVLPNTPEENVRFLVQAVHRLSERTLV